MRTTSGFLAFNLIGLAIIFAIALPGPINSLVKAAIQISPLCNLQCTDN